MIVGFDIDGTPRLFQTDPSGTYSAWKANATGRNSKTVKEFLEKNYNDEAIATTESTIKFAVKALLEVVESGSKNVEIAVVTRDNVLRLLDDNEIDVYVKQIEEEKEQEKEKQKTGSQKQ